jgi:hypothetical protein
MFGRVMPDATRHAAKRKDRQKPGVRQPHVEAGLLWLQRSKQHASKNAQCGALTTLAGI